MYNIFQHRKSQNRKATELNQIENIRKWTLKHQYEKQEAHENYIKRIENFVNITVKDPFYFEDDHFQQWRRNNRYRNTQQQAKFIGFKSFLHKPNKQMSSIYIERQRKQKQYLESKANKLVLQNLIPPQQRSRSLSSQGPLISATSHQFRDKPNPNYQPKFRFHSVTDKQRFLEHYIDEPKLLQTVYEVKIILIRVFDRQKSKIGKITIKSLIDDAKNKSKWRQKLNTAIQLSSNNQDFSEDIHTNTSKQFQQSINLQTNIKNKIIRTQNNQSKYYFQNIDKKPRKINNLIQKINNKHMSPLKKKHFKAMKEIQLGKLVSRDVNIRSITTELLKQCQYDRSKHLENIKNNRNHEIYQKPPIL